MAIQQVPPRKPAEHRSLEPPFYAIFSRREDARCGSKSQMDRPSSRRCARIRKMMGQIQAQQAVPAITIRPSETVLAMTTSSRFHDGGQHRLGGVPAESALCPANQRPTDSAITENGFENEKTS